ncbi:hypothetical protein C8R47DRAFT_1255155 [Mycena vitilis]|nr:hypothetical protein C8R47DRAFT_1255155 [Mycena vitilis]
MKIAVPRIAFVDETGYITDIGHYEFARAAHRVAHLRLQRQGHEGQVVALVALPDVLIHQTIVAGCIKAGLAVFQISHRNAAAAIMHLLRTTGTHPGENPPYELSVEEIPLLGQLYPHLGHETKAADFVPYPGPATRTALESGQCPNLTPEEVTEQAEISPRLAVGALPAFHTMGMTTQLLGPILCGGPACIYPPASSATESKIPPSPTATNAIENAKRPNADGIAAVPAMIQEYQSPADIAYLKISSSRCVVPVEKFPELKEDAEGPLPTRVGDFLVSEGVIAFQSMGRPSTVLDTHKISVENLPDVHGYSIKDIFEKYPTKPDLNKYRDIRSGHDLFDQ